MVYSCCVCVWVVFLPSLAAFQLHRTASLSALTNIRCHEIKVCGRIWSRIRSDNKSAKRWDTWASFVFHAQKCTSWQCRAIPEKIPGLLPRSRKTQGNIRTFFIKKKVVIRGNRQKKKRSLHKWIRQHVLQGWLFFRRPAWKSALFWFPGQKAKRKYKLCG